MTLARKVRSAARMVRVKGLREAGALARLRAREFYAANRPLPGDADGRARLLAAVLNRRSLVSAARVGAADLAGARDAVLRPYLHGRFAEAAAAAAGLAPLRPVEAAVAADCLLTLWDFAGIDAALPGWLDAAAGTPLAGRIAQVGRRAALRLGRIAEASRNADGLGGDVGALVLRGEVLDAAGRGEAARAALEEAVRRDGTDADARQALAFALLKAGRTRDGLASWGAADRLFGTYPLRRHRPHWAGEPLGARRLMVLFEHGLGDMIQVARFLPRLLAREPEAAVLARLPAPLLGLFRRQFPRVRFVSEDEREPDYDLFVPSMQLAAALDAPDLEPRARYVDLGVPAPRGSAPRVGVCWRGHPRQYEATRSVPLDLFARLFARRDVEVAVLLNRLTEAEAARLAGEPNVSAPPIRDFVDLAALVASCDLVVTVDTAVAHLAGAGGVPTALLSRPDSCWRWGEHGPEGPWYSTVEVLRHGGDLDWPRLLDAAAARIAALRAEPAAA